MKEIPLTQGKVALVDDVDYNWLSQWKWNAHYDGKNWYACRTEYNPRKDVLMHRAIMGFPENMVDHRNRNGLDNRRENLRHCTNTQNARNAKISKANTSGYKGVYWHLMKRKYEASIRVNRKIIRLGLYCDPEEAARAYDVAAKKYFGDFAYLNFPQEAE